jgi:polyribonucleotide nucleotidyltransferase
MKRKTKIWLIAASALILAGCILFGGVMTMLKWDFKKLSTVTYETNRYEINESYENILITVNTANITLVPSEDGKTIVECTEETKSKHAVKAENGTLEIKCTDTRKWYEHIGIGFQTTKITVYVPAGEYASLFVKATTGNTEIAKDFKFESVDISATT